MQSDTYTHNFVSFTLKVLLGLFLIGSSQFSQAQNDCDHLTLRYNVNQHFFALDISNNNQEEAEWTIEIQQAHYKLDANLFRNRQGINLTIESSLNDDGTFYHLITPDQPIGGFQFLQFVYDGVPEARDNNLDAKSRINCQFKLDPLCVNLNLNFFNETQRSFGFSVQNNNSVPYFPYEVHIENSNYKLDPASLSHDGFDYLYTENADGTINHYFIAQEPLESFSQSPQVRTKLDLGFNPISDGAQVACDGNLITSGLDGGLESHGGLASKIAKRNFKRALGISTLPEVTKNNNFISQLVPVQILSGDNLIETSPTDLIEITTAESIWAGDYFIDDSRFGSIFGSKTSEVIYDHTKVICDRVKGSELAVVDVVDIDGYKTILSIIRRPDASIEYAISFSLGYEEYGDFTMESHWSVDQYQGSPHYLNYQVWTNSRAKSIAAVQKIIQNIVNEFGYKLKASTSSPAAPILFARSAYYRLGAFNLELNNSLQEPTTISFFGTYNTKEVGGVEYEYSEDILISPGQSTISLDIPEGNIFEGGITILGEDNLKDVIYLADGSWGLEYQEEKTTINSYEIITDNREDNNDEYIVERGLSVSGHTDTYLSIFKQLEPGGLAVDLSAYNTLSFDANRNGVYQVTLLVADNTDPSKNLSYTLHNDGNDSVDIPFSLFSNAQGIELDPSNITTIFIGYLPEYNENGNFDITIENVRFRNDERSNLLIDPNNLNLYPNPSSGLLSITHLFEEQSNVTITISNVSGAIIERSNSIADAGINNFKFDISEHQHGLYLISMYTNKGVFASTVLLNKE